MWMRTRECPWDSCVSSTSATGAELISIVLFTRLNLASLKMCSHFKTQLEIFKLVLNHLKELYTVQQLTLFYFDCLLRLVSLRSELFEISNQNLKKIPCFNKFYRPKFTSKYYSKVLLIIHLICNREQSASVHFPKRNCKLQIIPYLPALMLVISKNKLLKIWCFKPVSIWNCT